MAIYITREDLLEIVQASGHNKLVMASCNAELNAKIRAGILQRAKYQPEWEQFPNRVMVHEAIAVTLIESRKLTRAQLELPEKCRLNWQPATLSQFRINEDILKCFSKTLSEGNALSSLDIEETVFIDLDRPIGEVRFTYTAFPEFL